MRHLKKSILPLVVGLALVPDALGALLLEDHFSYPNGNLGASGVGNTVWTGGNTAHPAITVDSNAALSYPGLFGATGSGVIATGGTFKKKSAGFTAQSGSNPTVYASFLVRPVSAVGGAKPFFYLNDGDSGSSSPPLGVFLDTSSRLGLGKNSGVLTNMASALNAATHLVVVRYSFQSGSGNDKVELWLDPISLGTNPIPVVTLSAGVGASDASEIAYVLIDHEVNQTLWLDEVRVGNTWAEVTPTDGSSPPPASPAPRFTQVLLSPDGLILRGTNGPANGAFDLLAATNVGTAQNQWDEIASDNFNASGQFDLTNPVAPGAGQRFFRLRVGSGTTPAVAPQITTQPTNLTVLANQTAVFYAQASGTAPLSYQWFFNTNTSLAGKTGATLTLNNVQANDAGAYSVIVTNSAGSATSAVAVLTVSNILAPPSITAQPQSQAVTEGQTAVFSVVAVGTPPLSYQWFFNTNTPLANQTNASLTLNSVSTNAAGTYSVAVTNNYGNTNSGFATLTVNPPSTNNPDFSHVGFAANGITLSGGAAGPTVYVGSETQLQAYSDVNQPYTIIITQSFGLTSLDTHIRNNKTVIGSNNVVLSGGGLYLYDATNVIIRNLTITGSPEDGIGLHFAEHVWIDHCTITDSGDGAIDITQQSDNITISWCHIYYSSPALAHRLASLIASSDSDSGNYRVTYHHNWFGTNCQERLPSVRFGRAHVFNNYYNAPGNNYCVRTRKEAECLVESNFFQNVQNPWEQYITGAGDIQGKLFATNNSVLYLGTANGVNWTGNINGSDGDRVMISGTDTVFTPPYTYTLHTAADVPSLATGNAGANQGPFAP